MRQRSWTGWLVAAFLLVFPWDAAAQVRPGIFTTLQTTDTTADSLKVGCALGSSTCTGGIKAGQAIFSGGVAVSGGTPSDKGLVIASGAPASTSNNLYQISGTLYFNGGVVAMGSSVSGTSGAIPVFTTSTSLGDSIMAQVGSDIDVTGSVDVSSSFKIGGTDINTPGTLSAVAYQGQSNTFTGGQTFSAGISTSGGAPSTHGIMMPSGVPGVTTTNFHNDSGRLKFATTSLAYLTDNLGAFGATTSAELAGVISNETGSGALVFAVSPSFTTPNIGAATATSLNGFTFNQSVASGASPTFTGTNFTGIPWAGVSKTGSSLSDLATRAVANLSDGSNVALLNANNSFGGNNTFTSGGSQTIGSGSGTPNVIINGGSGAGAGSFFALGKAGTYTAYIGHLSAILGSGTSSALLVYNDSADGVTIRAVNGSGDVTVYARNALAATWGASQALTLPGGGATTATATTNYWINAAASGVADSGFVHGFAFGSWKAVGYASSPGNMLAVGGYVGSQWAGVDFYGAATKIAGFTTSGAAFSVPVSVPTNTKLSLNAGGTSYFIESSTDLVYAYAGSSAIWGYSSSPQMLFPGNSGVSLGNSGNRWADLHASTATFYGNILMNATSGTFALRAAGSSQDMTLLWENSSGDDIARIVSNTGVGDIVFYPYPNTTAALTLKATTRALEVGGNIVLGSNYLSGDGGNEGISVDSSGNVAASARLGVTSRTTLGAGLVLTGIYTGTQSGTDRPAFGSDTNMTFCSGSGPSYTRILINPSSGNYSTTGMSSGCNGGLGGAFFIITNISATYTVTFKHNAATGADMDFFSPTLADVTLSEGDSIGIFVDSLSTARIVWIST